MISLVFSLMICSPSDAACDSIMRRPPTHVCHLGDRSTRCDRGAGSAPALDIEVEDMPLDVVVGHRDPSGPGNTRSALGVDHLEVALDVVGLGLLDVVVHGSPSCWPVRYRPAGPPAPARAPRAR